MDRILRIGTRGSELALWQARHVKDLIMQQLGADAELVIVHTSGDRDRSRALHQLPGSGFFTKELQFSLKDERVDLVVHSLKDLAIDEPEGLGVAAILQRHDPSDLLLVRPEAVADGPFGLVPGATLGTSSLRRAAQALFAQPDLVIRPIRGNVPTRLGALRSGTVDAVLLAAAGVERLQLDLSGLVARKLDVELFLPAPGQGALAIETRLDDVDVTNAIAQLNDAAVAEATRCERAVLKGLGGGCHLPLGALAQRTLGEIRLQAALGELDADVTRATLRRAESRGTTATEVATAVLEALVAKP